MEPDDLYGLPLERFTPERNALAKALRAAGHRDEAGRVAAMRKPSVAAWAVNQLVRTQRRAVSALLKAGDALRQAQSELVAGRGNADNLRKASERERAAVDELVEKARGLLSSEGRELGEGTLARVSETLHAAALDDDARARVQEGLLERELRHVGLGSGAAVVATEPVRHGRRGSAAKTKEVDRARAKRAEAARKAEAEARRALERASRELKNAERARDRAAQSLEEAEAAVGAARKRAEQAAREHARAQRELERA